MRERQNAGKRMHGMVVESASERAGRSGHASYAYFPAKNLCRIHDQVTMGTRWTYRI